MDRRYRFLRREWIVFDNCSPVSMIRLKLIQNPRFEIHFSNIRPVLTEKRYKLPNLEDIYRIVFYLNFGLIP